MLTFDADKHEYRWNGRVVPSVTGILKVVGLIDSAWHTPEATERGSMIHLATALDDRGELDEASVDERIAGYLNAWRHWRSVSGFEMHAIESPVYSTHYDYAGTLDRDGRHNGSRAVLDIKSGSPEPWHRLQLAAYAIARYGYATAAWVKRIAVYVADDGSYKMKTYNDADDLAAWVNVLGVYNWRAKHGVTD